MLLVGGMNSKDRIFHYPYCKYVKRIKSKNLIRFNSKDEARENGFKHCKYCSRLIKYYNEDKEVIDKFIKEHHMKMYINDDSMYIDHTFSCWKITTESNGYGLILYHGNTENYSKLELKDGHIQHHYHIQKYRGRREILHMLKYIVEHDEWKTDHADAYKDLPKRSKKQKKEYNKQRKAARRTQMNHLFNTFYKVELEGNKKKQG